MDRALGWHRCSGRQQQGISTGVGFLLSRPWRFHDGIWWATDDIGVEHRLDERAGRWYRQGESPQG